MCRTSPDVNHVFDVFWTAPLDPLSHFPLVKWEKKIPITREWELGRLAPSIQGLTNSTSSLGSKYPLCYRNRSLVWAIVKKSRARPRPIHCNLLELKIAQMMASNSK